MSKKLPETSNSEEVDLGQLFSYFERGFKKIGDWIVAIFELVKWVIWKSSLFILLVLATLKKHFIKIAAAGIVTFVAFYFLDKKSPPIYQSNVILKQNYRTGKLLYSNIANFNSLALAGDSIGLGKQLGIPSTQAAKFVGFQVRDYMNKNELLEKYDEYLKSVDSSLRTPFENYAERYDLENYNLQTVIVSAIDISAYEGGLSNKIISSLEENEYFKEEKERERELIRNKIKAQQEIVLKSDTLQGQYLKLLQKYYGATIDDESQQSTFNINLSNSKEKIETKEFALFEQQNILKLNLVELQNQLENKDKIVRLQKEFAPPFLIESSYSQNKNIATLLAMAIVLLFFVIREFGVFEIIDEYGNKEKLLEK